MKRLFEVVKDHKPMNPRAFYEHKADAKVFRGNTPGLSIIRGPDHQMFGVKGFPRTHSHAANGLNKKKGKK